MLVNFVLAFFCFGLVGSANYSPSSRFKNYVYQRPQIISPDSLQECSGIISEMAMKQRRYVVVVVVDSIQGDIDEYAYDVWWDIDFTSIFQGDVKKSRYITSNKTLVMTVETNNGDYHVGFYKGSAVRLEINKKSTNKIVGIMSECFDVGDWGGGVYAGLKEIRYKFDHPDDWWVLLVILVVVGLVITAMVSIFIYIIYCQHGQRCRCCWMPSKENIARNEIVKLEKAMIANSKKVLFPTLCLRCLNKLSDEHMEKMEKYAAYLEATGSAGSKERTESNRDTWGDWEAMPSKTKRKKEKKPFSSSSSSSSCSFSSSRSSIYPTLASTSPQPQLLTFPAEPPSSSSSSFSSNTSTATTTTAAAAAAATINLSSVSLSHEHTSSTFNTIDISTGLEGANANTNAIRPLYESVSVSVSDAVSNDDNVVTDSNTSVDENEDNADCADAHFTCNVCSRAINPKKKRYHCLVCEEYDMCEECFQCEEHNFTHKVQCFKHSETAHETIFIEDYYRETETAVGAEPFGDNDLNSPGVVILHCGHQFHRECLESLNDKDECIYCRAPHPRAVYPRDPSLATASVVPTLPIFPRPLTRTYFEVLKDAVERTAWDTSCCTCGRC